MNEEPRMGNLVDATDCLEAVSVIRCWKNFLFIIILLSLLLLQGAFWMVNLNIAGPDESNQAVVISTSESAVNSAVTEDQIKQAARAVDEQSDKQSLSQDVSGPQQSVTVTTESRGPSIENIKSWFQPRHKHVKVMVRFLDFALMPISVIYCLTMLFSLKISIIGRLGGINHIARAFFLSLAFVVLLFPWQLLFAPVFAGAMFTWRELIEAYQASKNTLAYISFYLRFTGYWLLVVLILLFAQIRSMRWARATLKRLEVI